MNLLICLRDHWQRENYKQKRFIQVCRVWEGTPFADNFYSATQDSTVQLGKAFFKTYNFPVIITCCCSNYGPYQPEEEFIPQSIIKALRREVIPVYGDGTNLQEWMYVLDQASVLSKILLEGQPGEVYNLGSGEYISNLELVKIIQSSVTNMEGSALKDPESLEQEKEQEKSPVSLDLEKNEELDLKEKAVTIGREHIRNITWQGSYSLREGIRETVQWYRENRAWWDSSG